MPDKEGKLTTEEKVEIKSFIDSKMSEAGRPIECTICRKTKWEIPEHLVELRPHTGGGLQIGGPVYPAILLVCTNCF
ncbi:MAG: hypothetical protein AAFW68_14595, partial [Pseudomonadota bacterium]